MSSQMNQPPQKKIIVRAEAGQAIQILSRENLINPDVQLLTPSEITRENIGKAADDFNELFTKLNPYEEEACILQDMDEAPMSKAFKFFVSYCRQLIHFYEANNISPELIRLYKEAAKEYDSFAQALEEQLQKQQATQVKKALPPPPKKTT